MVASKSGNSGKIREFYFKSENIRGKGEIFQKITENQGAFKFLIVSFKSILFYAVILKGSSVLL